jgi:hypothetical protein
MIKKQRLYTPLSTLDRPWESISNYMFGLPSTKHENDCVFVVVDRLFKMVVLETNMERIIVEAITKLFFEVVLVHFPPKKPLAQINTIGSRVLFGPACGR